jgi:hypothetical protein
MYNSSYTFLSIWRELSISYRLFVVTLAAVSVYSLISATIVFKRIRTLESHRSEETASSTQQYIQMLYRRCANLRQILTATFYLFGLLLFVGLQNAPITVGDGFGFPARQILGGFILHFVFAANVFLVFLILHVVQWVTCIRIHSFALRFGA